MSTQEQTKATEDAAAAISIMRMITGFQTTQAICTAVKLDIPELLAGGAQSSEQLAGATGAHPGALHRLMRALCALGVCRQSDAASFELTPLGAYLRRDVDGSLRSAALFWGEQLYEVWSHMVESVKTGQSAWKMLYGFTDFAFFAERPKLAEVFNQAMAEMTRVAAKAVVKVYDFSGISEIVDIGGGYGQLLVPILHANPKLRGVVFDMPHAENGAREKIAAAGLADRYRFVAGDFFKSVPDGASAYILKSVIHDWDDDQSVAILATCRRAMGPNAKLLLVEPILPTRMEVTPEHQRVALSDLNMLVAPGGRERTEAKFRTLFDRAGFKMTRIVPTATQFNMIEGVPA